MSDMPELQIERLPATALVVAERDRGDLYWDPAAFAHGQRVAAMFASSPLLPAHLQGKENIPAVMSVLAIARRTNEDPLTMLLALYVVNGRPGWSASYMIARAKRAGIRIDWKIERRPGALKYQREVWVGPKGQRSRKTVDATMPDLTVTAIGRDSGDPAPVEYTVDSAQAIAAGWAENEQYTHSAELMLRYRAATHLIRLYWPDVMLGLPTEDEIRTIPAEDVIDVTPAPAATVGRGMAGLAAALAPAPQPTPPPPSPSSAPSGGGDPAPASGGESPATKPSADVGTRAAALRERVRKRLDKGESVWPDELKTAYKGATGTARVGLDALKAAADYGAERGWWVVTTSTSETGEVTGYGLAPVEAEAAPVGGWATLSGDDLAAAVDALAGRLGDAIAGRAWETLGLDADHDPTESDLRDYGRALEVEERRLQAEAGGR